MCGQPPLLLEDRDLSESSLQEGPRHGDAHNASTDNSNAFSHVNVLIAAVLTRV
jgi:predicted heme/steroid binding protein